MMILFAAYLPCREGEIIETARQIGTGCLAMLILTAVGVLASRYIAQPFLIKLALQRSTSLVLLFSAFFIVPGLWRDATTHSNWLRAAAAVLALISPFFAPAGVPLALAVLIGSLILREKVRVEGWPHHAVIPLTVLTLGVAAAAFYITMALDSDWRYAAYIGIDVIATTAQGAVVAGLFIAVALRRWVPLQWILLPGLAIVATAWGRTLDEYRDLALREKAEDYMKVQQWAHDNTPVGTLFMPDPTHFYGWREVTLRPSFGNLREWLVAGWICNSRKDVFSLGIDHWKALGLSIEPYLKHLEERPDSDSSRLTEDARQKFYSMSQDDFTRIVRKYGVQYFVLDIDLRTEAPLLIVYQNDNYPLGSVPD